MNQTRFAVVTLIAASAIGFLPAAPSVAEPAQNEQPSVVPSDPTLEKLTELIKGHFKSDEQAIAFFEIKSQDAGPFLVGEFYKLDDPSRPEGQVLFKFLRRSDGIYLRTARFPAGSRTAPGMWAAPHALPMIQASGLDILSDLKVEVDSESDPTSFRATSSGRVPVFIDRAVEMETRISADQSGLMVEEIGYDSAGEEAFRFPEGGVGQYRRAESPRVESRPSGLIVVELLPGPADAQPTEEGQTFSVNYTGWLPNGMMFDSSRQEGRTPLEMEMPTRGLIGGWNQGVPGMKVGAMRRLIVPPDLGYGSRGQPQAGIPPESWLVFDIELMGAKPKAQPAPTDAAPEPKKPE